MTRLSDDPPVIRSSGHPATRNHISSISLSHFRNYHTERVKIGEAPVVLTGHNGAGKTNLLEAISLLTPGRGLRRASLSDIDNMQDHAPWAIAAEATGAQGPVSIGTGRDPEGNEGGDKRIVKMDGKVARAQTDLGKVFAALWLTPQMDNLFLEGGTARRKFLDRLVYSFDGEHASRVNAYEQAMRERTRLLSERGADPQWLDALEHKMAEFGVAIGAARQHAVEGLDKAMARAKGTFPKARITLTGVVEIALLEAPALAVEGKFREILKAMRAQDAQAGRCSVGTHRTQVDVTHIEKNLAAERCSTGEQKALLVAIILAQATAGALWHGSVPVLLLDEVAVHLDSTHRAELFEALTEVGAQCWLTGTDRDIFEGFEAQFLRVENGKVLS